MIHDLPDVVHVRRKVYQSSDELSQKVKDQWIFANKQLKDVIRFPKEVRGVINQKKQGWVSSLYAIPQ